MGKYGLPLRQLNATADENGAILLSGKHNLLLVTSNGCHLKTNRDMTLKQKNESQNPNFSMKYQATFKLYIMSKMAHLGIGKNKETFP